MQENLRQRFIDMNNFICDCERKKDILEKKIAIEDATGLQMDKDIIELEEKVARMTEYQENELAPSIAELSVYDEYIQKMVDESDLFTSQEDFIDRCNALRKYQTSIFGFVFITIVYSFRFYTSKRVLLFSYLILVLAQSEVKQNDEANLKKLEELRDNIVKISNEASLKFAEIENELAELEVLRKHFKWILICEKKLNCTFFCTRKHMKKLKLNC